MKQEPVSAEELRRAKDQLKGSLLLSLESTGSRMSNLARQEMYFGRFFTDRGAAGGARNSDRAKKCRRSPRNFSARKDRRHGRSGRWDGFRLRRDLLAC